MLLSYIIKGGRCVMIVYPQVHTSADLLKSTIRIEELIPFLQQQKAEACAIVNSKLYGLLPFWHAVRGAGIHAVIGLTVKVQFQDETVYPLTIYAKTNDGYQNILKMSSAIAIHQDELLPFRWLTGYAKGCIALVPILEANWLSEQGRMHFNELLKIFGRDNLFVGISRPAGVAHVFEQEAEVFSKEQHCAIVATQEGFFLQSDDYIAYEVAQAIASGVRLEDREEQTENRSHFLPTAAMVQSWFNDHPEWLESARTMLASCQVTIPERTVQMPKFPLSDGQTAEQVLAFQAMDGLKMRLGTDNPHEQYVQRLQYELTIINSMGYADYFLIVADFIAFARKSNILTGPGRGSSASSLVAYALQITQVDPLQYGLLFERFLNPERVSLPDIDVDFVDSKRQQVIQYVADKYGKSNVAQIITFGTLSAKAVARDVARVFGFDVEMMDFISRNIPNKPGITLRQAYEQSEQLRNWIAQDERNMKWFEVARKLEGLPRNSSTHAAGVVLSPKPLVEVVPIDAGHDGIYLTQWPMQEVEACGLVKMDFLGLRNLTILERIRWSIYRENGKWIDFERIPLNDANTFQLLQTGDTSGIFQLESEGMRQALRDICPTHFLDIVAVNALYRPGPMDFIAVYARRKRGQEQVVMPHPAIEPILRETYGVIIYQEQIMKIAVTMASFTIGQADLLRRAVSKKKREILEEQRMAFVNGSIKQGYPQTVAEEVYELIVRFADYGFPKSHAVAYSMISYQMAYLKANYPAHFFAALMSNAIGNTDKLHTFMLEAKAKGIEILPPSIEKSFRNFSVENGSIRVGLGAVKGVPAPFITELISLRKQYSRAFHNLFDLAVCLSAKQFKKKVIEQLIYAGAFDDFGKDRAVLLATLDAAIKHAEIVRPTEEIDYLVATEMLFGKPKYIEAEPMTEKEKLVHERESIGFYLSEHPILKERKKWPQVNTTIQMLGQMRQGTLVKLVGIVEEVRKIRTKKGEQMAFVQIQDEFGSVSVTLFPKEFQTVMSWLVEEAVVYIEGILEFRFGKPQIKVKTIQNSVR